MVKFIEIKNRKNNILRGILAIPNNIENPFIVLNLHGFGGSMSGYKYSHTHLSRALESNGFGCIRFDFYGCGEIDGEFEDMTFTGLIEDAIDVYNWLINSKITTSNRVILSGHSMGGYFNYDLYSYEPFSNAKGYKNDVLIIRGIDDKLVSDSICQSYLNCYENPKTRYIQIEGGDHNFSSIETRSECEGAIINFCKLISNK